ncbi:YidC/Oxa1 family membrane protein insertase [Egicoccus sp. AB-alg2]|uniref:YidC/Oxa1 family membrane protein insertase n=1 Tax=Egicoccus sp. AB-alg2 TaxID=3242693 RepID=UPI00359E0850
MGSLWETIRDSTIGALDALLTLLHDLVEPLTGANAWGWAIILLTIVVRVALLPLAIKQTRSMRAMQALAPQLKEIQKKYKVDRDLLRKDPEQYRAKRQKLNEEQMALYSREGVNPAASCLPLLLQAPIFLALFWTLRYAGQEGGELNGAPFYFFTAFGEGGLEMLVRAAGWPGWLLIVLMSGTMFWSQKQMMARNAAQMADNPMAQQQKMLLYIMPLFLAFISINFPLGILLYWVTTNVWQVAQQAIILREVKHEAEIGTLADHPGGEAARRTKPAKGNGKGANGKGANGKGANGKGANGKGANGKGADGKSSNGKGGDGKDAGSGPKAGGSTRGTGSARSGRDGKKPDQPGDRRPDERPAASKEPRTSKKRDHLPRRGGDARDR